MAEVTAWILGSSPSMTKGWLPQNNTPRLRRAVSARFVVLITEPGQARVQAPEREPVQGPAQAQAQAQAREPGLVPGRALGPEPGLQARARGCWPPGLPARRRARRRFCQRHNTQQRPG